MKHSDLVDLTLTVHGESDHAYLASDDGERLRAEWLPKSQVELERLERETAAPTYDAVITMPLWLAQEKGFI